MSNITIPLLPPVIALSGAEFIEVVQAGTSSRATVSQLASALATYTAGTGLTLSGNQFSITATGAAAGTYTVPSFSVNAQGQITSITSGAATGTGAVVLANSPTLVAPALGTPTSVTLTNAVGLPLSTGITGTLAFGHGGTGLTATPSNGQLLIGNGTGYSLATLTAGSNITITNTSGGITIASTAGGSGTVTSVNASGGTTGLTFSGGPVTTSGTLTLAGTLAVANGGTGVTTSTGTGSVVLSNSPTLVTPALGTPSSATLTNATGLPVSTGITGLGTGVATALGVNVGTAGSFVVNGSALGTPSSGTVTNLTGTASININGTVGATTPTTGAFTTVSASTSVSSPSHIITSNATTTTLQGSASATATTYTLPASAPGTNGYVLSSTTAGVMSWVAASAGTVTSVSGSGGTTGLTLTGGPITTSGTFTLGGTLAVTNGGTGVTTSTGTGSVVLSNSPTLVTPALGTPSSATLTNATGLPLSTGITGTLAFGHGGTGLTATPSNGQLLIGNGTGYSLATLTAGSNITITNTSGGSTISVGALDSSQISFTQSGTGAIPQTLQNFLWQHTINLADFFTGTLATTSDITAALILAVAEGSRRVGALGGVAVVRIPAGYYFMLSATVTIPSGVIIEGAGKVETYLRRTADYGYTFVVGTANPAANVQCAGIRNLCIFHDHGGGTVPSINPANWVNATTNSPAHIIAYTPVGCIFENLNINCLPFQFICQGGSWSKFCNIDTYGVYDDANTNMQEGLAGFLMAGDTSVTGSIPTWHHIDFCRFGGMTRPSTTVTYYNNNSKVTTKNIGPQNGLVFWMAESVCVTNCYTGACNSSGILFSSKSTDIISGVMISNHFFDPCGTKYQDAGLKFENRDTGGVIDGVTLTGCQWKGQTNGWRAIGDYVSTATNGSVKDLVVSGSTASVFVGNPVELTNTKNARIEMNISAYNCMNWYGGATADQAGAVHITSGAVNVTVNGVLGGGVYGETTAGANNYCVDGVRADDWVNSRVNVSATNAGMAGSLFVGPPAPVAAVATDADFTLTWKLSSPVVIHYGTLTANRVVTLAATNCIGGENWRVARSGGGAFTLTITGTTSKALSTNQWVEFDYLAGYGWVETASGSL